MRQAVFLPSVFRLVVAAATWTHAPRVSEPSITSNAQAEAAYTAMCSASTDTAGQQALAADINNFVTKETALSATFANISTLLSTLDGQSPNNTAFAPQWQALRQKLSTVHTDFGTASYFFFAYTEEFKDIFMPWGLDSLVERKNLTDSLLILQNIVPVEIDSDLKPSIQQATTDITALTQSFNDFYTKFTTSPVASGVTMNQAGAKLVKDAHALTMSTSHNVVTQTADALDAGLFLEESALELFPQFASVVLSAGSDAVGLDAAGVKQFAQEKNEAAGKFSSMKSQLVTLQKEESPVGQALLLLESAKSDLNTVSIMLNGFQSVLDYMHYDSAQLANYLNAGINSGAVEPWIYWQTVPAVAHLMNSSSTVTVPTCLYDSLQTAFLWYLQGGAQV